MYSANETQNGGLSLYPQQQEALNAIASFVDSDKSVFILRGYAGTGKTTLIKAVIAEIQKRGEIVYLMAPTGRATKILRERINCEDVGIATIHSMIYTKERLTTHLHNENGALIKAGSGQDKHEDDIVEYWFGLNGEPQDGKRPDQRIYIVDESSMISSRKTENEVLHFGTDVLLDDVLTFARLGSGGKLIFVGDPAQLPPVGDNRSAALDETYFADKGLSVQSFELTEVVRQNKNSAILENAMIARNCLDATQRNTLAFVRRKGEVEDIPASEVVGKYTALCPQPKIGEAVIICYSNNLAKLYNDAVRAHYYPDKKTVQRGDILQVCKNCYIVNAQYPGGAALFNGDFVTVLEASQEAETHNVSVWTNVGGKRTQLSVQLVFRDVVIQGEDGNVYDLKIIDSLLNGAEPRLTTTEQTALYIDYEIRSRKCASYCELHDDAYYNALNVKYGYAITGHKAQGGEWGDVFVDYTQRTGLNNDSLRWIYTATTRAKRCLYGVNMPNVQPFDKLQFGSIAKIAKPSAEAEALADVGNVEYLPKNAKLFQKAKCLSAEIALRQLGCSIENIDMLQYKDRYHINTPNGVELYDCTYNGAGIYTAYSALKPTENTVAIIAVLEGREGYIYEIDYTPTNDVMEKLYARIRSACDELDVTLTNVVEHADRYYVAYYFITSGKFSQIQFYYNRNGFVTYGQAASDMGEADKLLKCLIKNLS